MSTISDEECIRTQLAVKHELEELVYELSYQKDKHAKEVLQRRIAGLEKSIQALYQRTFVKASVQP